MSIKGSIILLYISALRPVHFFHSERDFMTRCKQSKCTTSYAVFVRRAVGLILMSVLCMGAMCGCAGEDKYVEIIIAGSDVVVTPVPKPQEALDGTKVNSLPGQSPEVQKPGNTSGATGQEATPVPTEYPTPTPQLLQLRQ